VQVENQVLVRYGRRGTEGHAHVKPFSSSRAAESFLFSQSRAKENKGYKNVCQGAFAIDATRQHKHLMADAEDLFKRHGHTPFSPIFGKKSGEEAGYFSVWYGLLTSVPRNPLHKELLVRLREFPHTEDISGDRILARVPGQYGVVETSGWAFVADYKIGPARGDETEEEITRVLALHYPEHPNPGDLFEVVRRLTRVT
jgi:predicted DNA-binding WGR domain protein